MGAVTAEVLGVYAGRGEAQAAEVEPGRCPEQELARRAAAGDARAFEEVYRRYQRVVYNLCLRMTRNAAEAEDITQEVFVNLYRKLGSFRGESQLSTWVHRVTVNRVLMHFRKSAVRHEQTTGDGEVPAEKPAARAGAQTPQQVDRIALERAVGQLPPGYRAVFILHDVEGYEHEEIARMLGYSAGTSKSQLHKARLKLRGLLNSRARAISLRRPIEGGRASSAWHSGG